MTATVLANDAAQSFNIADQLTAARSLFSAGRLDQAREACQRILERENHPGAWIIVGLTALRSGDTAGAVEALETATAIRPAQLSHQLLLGQAYLASGRMDDAIASFRRAHELSPASSEALLRLSKAEMAAGNPNAGREHSLKGFRMAARQIVRALAMRLQLAAEPLKSILAMPAGPRHQRSCRTELRRSRTADRYGDSARALDHLRKAIAADPADSTGYVCIARHQNNAFNSFAATAIYEEATKAGHKCADLEVEHARTLLLRGSVIEARTLLEQVLAAQPDHLGALVRHADVMRVLGKTEQAEALYRGVLERDANDLAALSGMAKCKVDIGESDEAIRWLMRVLDQDGDSWIAWRDLAKIGALSVGDEAFDRLLVKLKDPGLGSAARAGMHIAAGTVFDRAKDWDRAFDHFSIGNRLEDVTFSADDHDRYVDRLIATYDADFFARASSLGLGSKSATPVFIVGLPRSGTSLAEQILASHRDVFGAGELNAIGVMVTRMTEAAPSTDPYPSCMSTLDAHRATALATEYLFELHERANGDFKRITDKMPANFLHLGLIAALFPRARIIHCRRDPMDTCLSIFFQMFDGFHPYAYDLRNLGRYYRSYARLMKHWQSVLPIPMLELRYEDVIAGQKAATQALLSFCELDWDDNCLQFHRTKRAVQTASNAQVRQPIHSGSVHRWKAYEKHLEPLKAGLGMG
jgi:tetratricopeptide (TPR) repeat protein